MSTRDLTPAQRAVLRAAGQKGGLTGRKNTEPARLAQLRAAGAAFLADGTLDGGHPDTVRARRRMAAQARLARAQKAVQRERRRG